MSSRLYPPPDSYEQKLFGPRVPKQALYGRGLGLFGDGSYSGNIVQGGVTLQPQDYLLDGITPLQQCIVVTNTATVAPNGETGSAVAMGHNLAVVGASASLSSSTNAKGLVLLFDSGIYARSGAKIHMDRLGKAGNFGNLTAYDLAPATLKAKLSQTKHAAYVVQGEGAAGARAGAPTGSALGPGFTGDAAPNGSMKTGGGGSGQVQTQAPNGTARNPAGKGGPCSGGAGSGGEYWSDIYGSNAAPSGDYGGPGGKGVPDYGCSGPGDPPGTGASGGSVNATGAGGGLLMLFAPLISIASGCIVSADGAPGTPPNSGNWPLNSGGAGGGCVVTVTRPGGYSNSGTVRAVGGVGNNNGYAYATPGSGGAGSVNTFQDAA